LVVAQVRDLPFGQGVVSLRRGGLAQARTQESCRALCGGASRPRRNSTRFSGGASWLGCNSMTLLVRFHGGTSLYVSG